MKLRHIFLAACVSVGSLIANADNEWLHLFYKGTTGVTRVVSTDLRDLQGIDYVQPNSEGAFTTMRVRNSEGTKRLTMTQLLNCEIGKQIPVMRINIENNAEVIEKDTYLNATASLQGNGYCSDFASTAFQIKGRGNSTWGMPKKPYRMKFEKKQSLAGLPKKSKNFALIANYIDPTQMRNVLALWLARKVGIEFTNNTCPVELYVNNSYRGIYLITEKIGINSASVDIDETEGILWEIDTNFDEPFKYRSPIYHLPMMVKDPDFAELEATDSTTTANARLDMWQNDFNTFEQAVAGRNGKDWTDLMDMESLVKYMFVYCLTVNQELKHPKSTYLHKSAIGEKYVMGPAWDFDWAYTYDSQELTTQQFKPLMVQGTAGYNFFYPMLKDSRFMTAYKALMNDFFANNWDEFMTFFSEYASLITPAAYHNGEKWPPAYNAASSEKHAEYVETLRKFLNERKQYMLQSASGGLY